MLVLAVLVEALAAIGSTATRAALLARAGDLLLVRGDFLVVGQLSLTRSPLPKAVAVDVVTELDALAATIELPRPATVDALVLAEVVAATLLTLSIAVASLVLAVSALLSETARFFAFLVTAPYGRGVDFSMIELVNEEEIASRFTYTTHLLCVALNHFTTCNRPTRQIKCQTLIVT